MNKFCIMILFLTVLIVSGTAGQAHAHRVVVFAWIDGNTVYTESSFPDGRKITDGDITVYDGKGTVRVTGKPDEKGEFSFKIPDADRLRIVLNAGMGHQGEWIIPEKELRSAASGIKISTPEAEASLKDAGASDQKAPDMNIKRPVAGLDETAVRQIVSSVLDDRLKPIKKTLAEIQQKKGPAVSDIFGGIGYILGLMGIAAWFYSKKK